MSYEISTNNNLSIQSVTMNFISNKHIIIIIIIIIMRL